MYNATCRIMEPETSVNRTDALTRDHSEDLHPEQRCSLRRMNIGAEAHVLGAAGAAAWRCRLQSSLPIAPGWVIRATLDGETVAHDYTVGRAARTMHWDLLVQRVG